MKRLALLAVLVGGLVACGGSGAHSQTHRQTHERRYRVPSSAMEPTLNCAKPVPGCLGTASDTAVVRSTGAKNLTRLAIVVFETPRAAARVCGEGGTFIKRVIGRPGETVKEDTQGFIWIRGGPAQTWTKLDEPYISRHARELDASRYANKQWSVPAGAYFVLGDNRSASCDSRAWGSVPARNIIGPVVRIIRAGKVLRPAGDGAAEQGVAVTLRRPDANAVFALDGKLGRVIAHAGVGEYDGDGSALDGSESNFYAYGPDADALWKVMKPLVEAAKPRPGSYVELEYGTVMQSSIGTVRIRLP